MSPSSHTIADISESIDGSTGLLTRLLLHIAHHLLTVPTPVLLVWLQFSDLQVILCIMHVTTLTLAGGVIVI